MSLGKSIIAVISIPMVVCIALPSLAQSGEQPIVKSESQATFGGLAVLPSCLNLTVYRGNPMAGPSLLLIKATKGCVVPWHWHTAREELMMVSGKARIEIKGTPASSLAAGDYALIPGKHHHEFACETDCVLFDAIADTFDIHYLDKSGSEIPVEQALSAVSEKPGSSQ